MTKNIGDRVTLVQSVEWHGVTLVRGTVLVVQRSLRDHRGHVTLTLAPLYGNLGTFCVREGHPAIG
jgi:hypothetical protein